MKKRSGLQRIICLSLVLAMLAAVLISCANTDDDPEGTTDPAETTTGSTVTTAPDEAKTNLPERTQYTGEKFRVWTTTNELGGVDTFFSTKTDGNTGEAISDALFSRQITMEDYFDIEVESTLDPDLYNKLITAVGTNSDEFDIVIMPARKMMESAVSNGYLTDLNQRDEFNLDASYWDQRIQTEYNIQGRLYTLEGDFSIVDELRTNVIIYNKDLYEQYGYNSEYGTPYSLVAEGSWTLKMLLEMSEGLSQDLQGDGLGSDDMWSIISEVNAPYTFYLGSGRKTIVNDDDGLSLTYKTDYEGIYNIIEQCMEICENPEILFANRGNPISSDEDYWTIASDMFMNGQALFRTTTLSAVTRLRDMRSDYGILPIAKIDQKQDGYYCLVSADNHCPLAIPVTAASHYERTAELTEAFCYFSRYRSSATLYDAFFETMTYARLCRTEDDINMLNVVFNSKTFDLDFAAAITGTQSTLWSISKNQSTSTLSSSLGTIRDASSAKLTNYFQLVMENGGN